MVIDPPVSEVSLEWLNSNLCNTADNFIGGKCFHSLKLWQTLSGDSWVHDVITGKILEFEQFPEQSQVPNSLKLHVSDQLALDNAMLEFIVHGIVELCDSTTLPCLYSNVFPIPLPTSQL